MPVYTGPARSPHHTPGTHPASTAHRQPVIDNLQTQIADKDKLIADLKDALLKLQEQNDSLQAQITSARTGGNGAKDAKESTPANSK